MSEYTVRPLDVETWDAFARLLDKHNGAGFGAGWPQLPARHDTGPLVSPHADAAVGERSTWMIPREVKIPAAACRGPDFAGR
jgi:hypothetical protein